MERSLARRGARTAWTRSLARGVALALASAATIALGSAPAGAQAVEDYRGLAPWPAGSPPASVGTDTVVWLQPDGTQGHPGTALGGPTHVIHFQDPLPGQPRSGTLTLFVVDAVPVPDLSGLTVAAAQKLLSGMGLALAIEDGTDPTGVQESQIASHSPEKTTAQLGVGEPITIGGTVGVILVSPLGQTFSPLCVVVAAAAAVVGFAAGALVFARRRARPAT